MITKPKGCYDVTGEVAKKYQRICEVVSAYAKIYNYKYIIFLFQKFFENV